MDEEGYEEEDKKIKAEGDKNATEKLRSNPWILSSFVLGIFVIVLLIGSFGAFSFSSTGNAISADKAGNALVSFFEQQGATGLTVDSVKEISGVYQVNILYNGNIIPSYITKDGKYAGQLTSIKDYNSGTNSSTGGDVSAFTSDTSLYPSLGPENAKDVVVEFADFQCIWCALASGLPSWATTSTTDNSAKQMISQSGDLVDSLGKVEDLAKAGKIKFVYVPVSFFGQESVYSAQAALCANEQGKFWQMHDAIYKASGNTPAENTGKYSKENLITIAKSISGLDMSKFSSCLNNDETLAKVNEIMTNIRSFGITGTPTIYLNGNQVQASWSEISGALSVKA